MKKSLQHRIIMTGAVLCFSALAAFPGLAANLSGHLDSINDQQITGWAWDQENPSAPVTVNLTITGAAGPGGVITATVTADQPHSDLKKSLGSSNHAFSCQIDWNSYEGETFLVTAEAVSGDIRTPLEGTLTYNKEKTAAEKKTAASGMDTSGTSGDEKLKSGERSGPTADNTAVETGVQGNYLGEYTASGYCNCSLCSGGHNRTSSGTIPKSRHTIAADTSVFPIGTKIMIDDVVYTVEDTGGSVTDNRLDIFFDSHQEALDHGLKKVKVYSVQN